MVDSCGGRQRSSAMRPPHQQVSAVLSALRQSCLPSTLDYDDTIIRQCRNRQELRRQYVVVLSL